jgi:HEAT repeat protein
LKRLLDDSDSSVQSQALRAAEYWATPDDIPSLLAALKTAPNYSRGGIIRALAATGGNEQVAAVLVRLLETNSRYDAASALISMKECAKSIETLVLPLLESSDNDVRRDACRILGELGGAKSQAALDALLAKIDHNDLFAFSAKQAREQIKGRLAVEPE